ncbi:hypothetical protein NDU88_002672 [Pleurodeles waltl]|uniref:Uncharacterized protein n=1 Tax=Pleurodeles waltl TaxID=8319 RepID=A0AAV7T3Y0_PLEWA|nr:hypothetical protein NDU88_002672 [Pleurodeles waltl]
MWHHRWGLGQTRRGPAGGGINVLLRFPQSPRPKINRRHRTRSRPTATILTRRSGLRKSAGVPGHLEGPEPADVDPGPSPLDLGRACQRLKTPGPARERAVPRIGRPEGPGSGLFLHAFSLFLSTPSEVP